VLIIKKYYGTTNGSIEKLEARIAGLEGMLNEVLGTAARARLYCSTAIDETPGRPVVSSWWP